MDLEMLYDYGFEAEHIVDMINRYLSCDDVCSIIYNLLNDSDIKIPDEVSEHYDLHCRN